MIALRTLVVFALLSIPPLTGAVQAAPAEESQAEESTIRVDRGVLVEGIACANDPTQTYTLYLPSDYTTERTWPVLYVFDPRGRSVMAAEIFRAAAERYGWILMSSDNTRSDGPWDPNLKAIAAMGPDVARYAFNSDRIYAAGFSGGAVLAWIWGLQTRGLAGVIASGGRPLDPSNPRGSETDLPFVLFGAAGDEEFNYEPTRELIRTAASLGVPHRFESFPGPHAWMPSELAFEAIEWMEIQAMRSGSREADADLLAALYGKDLAKARDLEAAGRLLEAQRRFDAIARTFEGLLDVEEVTARATALARSSEVKKAVKAEDSARRYETTRRNEIGRRLGRFRALTGSGAQPGVIPTAELEVELGVPALVETAKKDTAKGFAARRALSSLLVQVGFYMPRTFFERRDYERAAVVLELASRIGPPQPFVLYNLASAWAQTGRRKRAVSALSDAVDAGFSNLEFMQEDPDLAGLRELPAYKDLVARMKEAQ